MRRTSIRNPFIPLVALIILLSTSFPLNAKDLKVVLYPYIPDAAGDCFQNLKVTLADKFKKETGLSVSIEINPQMNLYSLGVLERLLSPEGSQEDKADVVELDTILLGDLVEKKWIADLTDKTDQKDIAKNVQEAVTIDERTYGFPTYLCTNVIYSYDQSLVNAKGGESLLKILSTNKNARPLVGNYKGSWTLPNTYLDALADTKEKLEIPGKADLDQETIDFFKPLVDSCKLEDGKNPCLDGTYKNNDLQAEFAFAEKRAAGFFGFTERLFHILKIDSKRELSTISAPMGKWSKPVMFVDALVIRSTCTGDCFTKAKQFIEFMGRKDIRNLIAFSEDAKTTDLSPPIPRYLLQANMKFYEPTNLRGDAYYPIFKKIIEEAIPFPNNNKLLMDETTRKELGEKVTAALMNKQP